MILQSGSTILRPLQEDDLEFMARLANNKNVWDNLRDLFPHPYTLEDARAYFEKVRTETPQVSFAMKYHGAFAGMIGLIPQQDVYRLSAEIGYWLGEPFWNKGIGKTAVKLVTDYGLYHLDFIRIYADVFDFNKASMRVLERNGYVKEGVFKKAVIKNGVICDDHHYAIVKPSV